jgi:hypothetical protein
MNTYRLSIAIDKDHKALGLSDKQMSIINHAHQISGASLGTCFVELLANRWNLEAATPELCRLTDSAQDIAR